MRADLVRALRALSPRAWAVTAVALAAVVLLPFFVSSYRTSFALSIAMYIVLAASWNLISGYTGYVSFGHVVFWGVGAYGTAVLMNRFDVSWFVGLLGGVLTALVLALLVARPILKLSGVYFAISTLAIAEATAVFTSYFDFTGGGGGLHLPATISLRASYYLMWFVAAISVAITYTLRFTMFGRSLVAIRENEAAAGSLGIRAMKRKIEIFALSAGLAGAAGSVYVLNVAFIDPGTAYDITITLRAIMMAMFGGIGTVLGPVVGPIAFQIPSEFLWALFPYVHKAVLGALIVLVVLVVPRGLVPAFTRRRAPEKRPTTPTSSAAGQQA